MTSIKDALKGIIDPNYRENATNPQHGSLGEASQTTAPSKHVSVTPDADAHVEPSIVEDIGNKGNQGDSKLGKTGFMSGTRGQT